MKKMSIALIFAVCLLVLGGFSVTSASNMGDLVNKSCATCHSAKRVCLNLGVKSEKAWVATVQNMIAKGAPISSDLVGPIAVYLTKLEPGTGPLCD